MYVVVNQEYPHSNEHISDSLLLSVLSHIIVSILLIIYFSLLNLFEFYYFQALLFGILTSFKCELL